MSRSNIARFLRATGALSGGRDCSRWLELPAGKWFPQRLLRHQEERGDPRVTGAAFPEKRSK